MTDGALIEAVRRFVRQEIAPAASTTDRTGELPDGLWSKLAEVGLTGLTIPARWGGVEADLGSALAAIEVLAAGCGSTAWAVLAHWAAARGIVVCGDETTRQRYLPALADGRMIGTALAVTEAGGGSNPMAIRTTARPDGDGWLLDGSKLFTSQAGVADIVLVLARTSDAPGPAALSCFVVDKRDRGLGFGAREEMMGVCGIQVREITFDGCPLPADRLLGGVGGGLAVLGAVGSFAVMGAASAAVGLAQAAADATEAHVEARMVLGKPLSTIRGVQVQMTQVSADLAQARASVARGLASLAGPPQGPPLEAWRAKIEATEAALRVVDRCLGLHGAAGYSKALPLERLYRDARGLCIHWGNNDVLRDALAT